MPCAKFGRGGGNRFRPIHLDTIAHWVGGLDKLGWRLEKVYAIARVSWPSWVGGLDKIPHPATRINRAQDAQVSSYEEVPCRCNPAAALHSGVELLLL